MARYWRDIKLEQSHIHFVTSLHWLRYYNEPSKALRQPSSTSLTMLGLLVATKEGRGVFWLGYGERVALFEYSPPLLERW